MNELKQYTAISKYSRWVDKDNRRETWEETVDRYLDFFSDTIYKCYSTEDFSDTEVFIKELREAILYMEVMPSMRCMMTAGKALERDNIAAFNCTAISVTHPRVFDEIFYILMCGCGCGFSVERQYVNQLPEVSEEMFPTDSVIVVADSKIGWASALRELISLLYSGKVPKWDLSKVRPAGARLKVFGGRASGPEPLSKLFCFTVNLFNKARGRKLNSIECHDLCCMIANTVIVGSVRRSACISFSNLTDDRMRRCKTGQWWLTEPHRALSNNATAYTEKPDMDAFSKEMRSMYKSRSGERSVVNLVALQKKAAETGRLDNYGGYFILNPLT